MLAICTIFLRMGLVTRLLRAGASLDNCFRGGPIEDCIRFVEENDGDRLQQNERAFHAAKAFIAEVRAAGGTWKKWLRAPHRDVIRLRSLLVRKQARTSDPVLAFVFGLGDNGVFWKLLEYWPGRVLPGGVEYGHKSVPTAARASDSSEGESESESESDSESGSESESGSSAPE